MTSPTGPVLYLPLDVVTSDGKVLDASGNGNDGTATSVVAFGDRLLGGAVEMEQAGAAISVASASDLECPGDMTLEVWIRVLADGPPSEPWIQIAAKGPNNNQDYALWCCAALGVVIFNPGTSGDQVSFNLPGGFDISTPRWIHLAGVRAGDRATLYVDGQAVGNVAIKGSVQTSSNPLGIGIAAYYTVPYCRLSRLRIYNRALSSAEVWRDYVGDQAAPFIGTYPIEFSLRNQDQENVLYIDDLPSGPGHDMSLCLRNESGKTVYLEPLGGAAPSASACHFELRFRPGTIVIPSPGVFKILGASVGTWTASDPVAASDGSVSIFVTARVTSAWGLSPADEVTLQLDGLVADGRGGSRAVRVELRYGALSYAEDGKSAPVSGSRTSILNIVNARGKKTIPLHAGFSGSKLAGSNRVLNDGTTYNQVTLRITNLRRPKTHHPSISFAGPDDEAPSKLLLSFEVGDASSRTFGLATQNQLSLIVVSDPTNTLTVEPPSAQEDDPTWRITFPKGGFSLAPGAWIELSLAKIVTSLPAGQTSVFIHYVNVPGYWDGQLVCLLEKSPLLFDDDGKAQDLGLGNALLDFNGDLQLRGTTLSIGGSLQPQPGQPISPADFAPKAALSADSSGTLIVNPAHDFSTVVVNGGVRARSGAPNDGNTVDNGYAFQGNGGNNDSGMFSTAGGLLQFFSNASERFRIDGSGNATFGTYSNLPMVLSVTGDVSVTGSISAPTISAGSSLSSSGTLSATGTATAANFVGDGSTLSNVVTRYAGRAETSDTYVFGFPAFGADLVSSVYYRFTITGTLAGNFTIPAGAPSLCVRFNQDAVTQNFLSASGNYADYGGLNAAYEGYTFFLLELSLFRIPTSPGATPQLLVKGSITLTSSYTTSSPFVFVWTAAGDFESSGLYSVTLVSYDAENSLETIFSNDVSSLTWSLHRFGD